MEKEKETKRNVRKCCVYLYGFFHNFFHSLLVICLQFVVSDNICGLFDGRRTLPTAQVMPIASCVSRIRIGISNSKFTIGNIL